MKGLFLVSFLLGLSLSVQGQSSLCAQVGSGLLEKVSDPHDCSVFHECFDGEVLATGSCPSGFWFEQSAQSCLPQAETSCSSYPVNPDCAAGLVDYYPYPYDCSKYIECYHGTESLETCPNGLWFNPTEKRCVDPSLSNCGVYTPSPVWTTPTDICRGVIPGAIVLKPYPEDCTRYYECYGADLSENSCSAGLWFSEDRQMCDWPVLVDCEWSNGDNPTPAPGTGFDDPRCVAGISGYFPSVNCNEYVQCYNGLGYAMYCPTGLYFNAATQKCTTPETSGCGSISTKPPTPSTEPNWTPDPLCPWPNYDRYLFPYSGNCNLFWECWYGEKTLMHCPDGLYFNPVLTVCDYPYEAGCEWASL